MLHQLLMHYMVHWLHIRSSGLAPWKYFSVSWLGCLVGGLGAAAGSDWKNPSQWAGLGWQGMNSNQRAKHGSDWSNPSQRAGYGLKSVGWARRAVAAGSDSETAGQWLKFNLLDVYNTFTTSEHVPSKRFNISHTPRMLKKCTKCRLNIF